MRRMSPPARKFTCEASAIHRTGAPGRSYRATAGTIPLAPRWRELFYLSNEGKLMSVKVKSGSTFQAEAPQVLFQVPDFHRIAGSFGLFSWAVSPDGERFLIARDPPPTEPISVVLNWPAEMTK